MERKIIKIAGIILGLILVLLMIWRAYDVFLIAFAAILLAILLNTIGHATQRVTHLPYILSLLLAIICIVGLLTLIIWLYSPLIAHQFDLLIRQLPDALATVRNTISPILGKTMLSNATSLKGFSLSNEKFLAQLVTVFSVTLGTIVSFVIFLIIGLYLAVTPQRYVHWVLYFVPPKKKSSFLSMVENIEHSLRWWILGKLLSMTAIGVMTFVGLILLNVSLAFILALLSALLAFIPYFGAIMASIPAILIAFTQSPLKALYVTILYLGVHMIEGYMITPYIEQRTVSIPPAWTILMQVLLFTLVGFLGFALATPLFVLLIAFLQHPHRTAPNIK